MKIQRDHGLHVNKGHPKTPSAKNPKTPASESKNTGRKDEVQLSSHAEEVRRLTELAKLAPDVRLDKVDAIKKQIKAGTYSVPADSVARSIADLNEKLKRDDE